MRQKESQYGTKIISCVLVKAENIITNKFFGLIGDHNKSFGRHALKLINVRSFLAIQNKKKLFCFLPFCVLCMSVAVLFIYLSINAVAVHKCSIETLTLSLDFLCFDMTKITKWERKPIIKQPLHLIF